jgi:acetylornithine deacetylase/succinyl-diaminopimelate desuccinylase-like protein
MEDNLMDDIKDVLTDLLTDIVSIPSVNGTEERLGDFLYDFGLAHGLGAYKQYCTDTRFNVLLTYPPVEDLVLESGNQEFSLLLHGHYDTVPPLDMIDPFTPRIEGDDMVGRGTVDQKAGLAAAVISLVLLKSSGLIPYKPVCLAAVIDEESEHRGSMVLSQSGLTADFGIVTEPSGMHAVLGCKGTVPIQIQVTGKAAHGCRPWLGINAVQKSMGILRRLFDIEFEPKDFGEGLGVLRDSINVGVVSAGSAYNNVPDTCVISLDCRVMPGEDNAVIIARIQQVIEEAKSEDPELQASYSLARPDWSWNVIKQRGLKSAFVPQNSPVFAIAALAHESVTKNKLGSYITDGYADLDFLINDMGIPSIIYGPGNPRLCHTAQERVSLEETALTSRFYYEFIQMMQSYEQGE